MKKSIGLKYVPGLALVGFVGAVSSGCSAANAINNAVQATQGCDEFTSGGVAGLQIDAKTKAFVQATADLVATAKSMETSVYNACKAIDTDLMVPDTWTKMNGLDAQVTEACTQANTKINAILAAAKTAQVVCGLSVSGGECTVNASAQASCEASCQASATCMEPDITVRCQPGELTGSCSGMCIAGGTCEGTASVEAACNGTCEADCDGECDGSTTAQVSCNGTCSGNCTGSCVTGSTTMVNGAMCTGTCQGTCDAKCTYATGVKMHCQGTCNGKCTGNCTLASSGALSCGAMVNCRGGCMGTYTAPSCEGALKPAMCMGDANCQGSCQGDAALTAMCTPPVASLECEGTLSTDLQSLVTTLQKNLPAIILAAQTQGPLAGMGSAAVVQAGGSVVGELTTLSGKALACATAATQAYVGAVTSLNATVTVSVTVSASASAGS
jgi:hypothetical protein